MLHSVFPQQQKNGTYCLISIFCLSNLIIDFLIKNKHTQTHLHKKKKKKTPTSKNKNPKIIFFSIEYFVFYWSFFIILDRLNNRNLIHIVSGPIWLLQTWIQLYQFRLVEQ